MHTTSRLSLQVPDGTDPQESFPAQDAATLAILDNAALYLSGTLAARPSASSTVSGTSYYCTDTGALLLCVAGVWVWPQASTELVGTVKQYSATTVAADPDGVQRWHVADGSAISRTAYPAYYSLIGTTWGAGDGSTTFNIPDLRGKVVVGAGSGTGLTTRTVAQNGGEETHTLAASESGVNGNGSTQGGSTTGSGTTSGQSNDHTHSGEPAIASEGVMQFSSAENPYGIGGATSAAPQGVQGSDVGPTSQDHTHSVPSLSIPSLGLNSRTADSAHNNMQPFGVGNHIVKIL